MVTSKKIPSPTSVALGFFDGVHLGHAALIKKTKEFAKGEIKSVIYTLDKHPSSFFGENLKMITPLDERIELLETFCTDYIYLQKTDRDFLNMTPEEFVDEILVKKLGASYVVSGENYTFGKNKSGSSALLKKLCNKRGINYSVVPYSKDGRNIISSTLIRRLLSKGDIPAANRMLGRNFSISGKVIRCRQVGSTLGFPTANILPQENAQLPMSGVYATSTTVWGKSYSSITNVGTAPTFNEDNLIIESHILDFEKDIYSQNITIEFISLIRPQKKFPGPDELVCQLKKDTEARRKI
ncbi:MAG: bifunctional riboflavin kinase/FAD synthetase [Monoglobales bacterium]